jgi:hypothetical protein
MIACLIIAYAFIVLGGLNLVIFGWLFLHASHNRWPVVLMLLGHIGGRLLFLLERANLINSILPLDLLGMAFEFLMYALALFGFHIFDPISRPARQRLSSRIQGCWCWIPREESLV